MLISFFEGVITIAVKAASVKGLATLLFCSCSLHSSMSYTNGFVADSVNVCEKTFARRNKTKQKLSKIFFMRIFFWYRLQNKNEAAVASHSCALQYY